ncbi:MAG: hypothetical protein Ct9H90mP11_09180 [Acidimicrobiales bacterium]|nr:MAG: hypothetical protein Ct9H90mP11_09180 [Acidimicrobiales bacterium]
MNAQPAANPELGGDPYTITGELGYETRLKMQSMSQLLKAMLKQMT